MKLKKATPGTAFFKCGLYGFSGSGKTTTAMEFAFGLCEYIGKKSIAFLDTEKGSDFFIKKCEDKGIDLYVQHTRTFTDIEPYIKECEKEGIGVLVIDSVTHFWRELVETYKDNKKNYKGQMTFQDWGTVKPMWEKGFTRLMINSELHIIVCGRGGYEYEDVIDSNNKANLVKVDTKMKAESEFEFEPSLVIEMVSEKKSIEDLKNEKSKWVIQKYKTDQDEQLLNTAYVRKDRSDTINGTRFAFPKFEHILPHVKSINIGGVNIVTNTQASSLPVEETNTSKSKEYEHQKREAKVAYERFLDEITLINFVAKNEAEKKKAKVRLLKYLLNDTSATAFKKRIDDAPDKATEAFTNATATVKCMFTGEFAEHNAACFVNDSIEDLKGIDIEATDDITL